MDAPNRAEEAAGVPNVKAKAAAATGYWVLRRARRPCNEDGSQMPYEDPAVVELTIKGWVQSLNPKVDEGPDGKARREQAKSANGKRLLGKPREKVQTNGSNAKRPLVKLKEKVPMKGFVAKKALVKPKEKIPMKG
ncbi:hypothetical protein L7F22_044380 [Adiantum nelumboides]|nr:hypothetical protein [Adiantum nelumboides]